VLDGLVGALVTDALDVPVPWSTRGRPVPGSDAIVVEMVAALSGDRVGRLHPATPLPPLVHEATAELERLGLAGVRSVTLDMRDDLDRERSRLLHRLRVLGIPGFHRASGPSTGVDPLLEETWSLQPSDVQLPALIEAGAYGLTVPEAAAAALEERFAGAGPDVEQLARTLFDVAFCGLRELSERVATAIDRAIGGAPEIGPVGSVLGIVLGLWRHDRQLEMAGNALLGVVIVAAVDRILWLAEGLKGAVDPRLSHILAVVALRDALVHASGPLTIAREPALLVMERIATDPAAPPDLRGAAVGFQWVLGAPVDPARALRGATVPATFGDWLAGLFALAREQVLATDVAEDDDLLGILDTQLGAMAEDDFLVALPAMRMAFGFFPPREREIIAQRLLSRHGKRAPTRTLLRTAVTSQELVRARELETRVEELLGREGLLPGEERHA
jgi:hypothetical protein